jgi:hypothetical protein
MATLSKPDPGIEKRTDTLKKVYKNDVKEKKETRPLGSMVEMTECKGRRIKKHTSILGA